MENEIIICLVKNKFWTGYIQRTYQQAWKFMWRTQFWSPRMEQSEDFE
jgi:hypothetical protein